MVNNGRDGHQAAVRLDPDQAEAVGDEDDVSVVADGQARWTDQADWTDHPLGADPAFTVLRGLRRVGGTPLDPFGYSEVRQLGRELIEGSPVVGAGRPPRLATDPADVPAACELPDMVRGYEDVKLRNIATFRERAGHLSERFAARR